MRQQVPTWLWALVGLAAWCSAGAVLAFREHFVYQYVVYRNGPLGEGIAWPLLTLAVIAAAMAFAAATAIRRGGEAKAGVWRASLWLISCAAIPAIEQARQLGIPIPETFLEPLFFALATGTAVWQMRLPSRNAAPSGPVFWRLALFACIALAAAWWCFQGEAAYRDYQLGYPDFADYAHRVANTWAGRGFLAKSPHWPAFYDHFHPGLALLAPLWGLWPDARLFVLLQAVCLAAPAALVAGLARRFDAGPAGAVLWAAAYLALPAVGQLNLSYSYGFHPVSLALVTVMAALWAAVGRRPWLALALAILSCSFEESVFVALTGMCAALAAVEFQWRRSQRAAASQNQCEPAGAKDRRRSKASPEGRQTSDPSESPTGVPPGVWLLAALGFAAGFVAVVRMAHLAEGTLVWRFRNLGDGLAAAALSPVLRPGVFWGQIFRPESFFFVLSLFVPAGLAFVARGWRALLGLALPLLVLLTWSVDGSTCIALQYVTLLVPCIVLAALLGASAIVRSESDPSRRLQGDSPIFVDTKSGTFPQSPSHRAGLMASAGMAVLAGGVVASVYFGALPFSRPTIPFALGAEDRAARAPRLAILDHAVEMVSGRSVSVLASCRLAAHLLGTGRLEDVNFALRKRDALAKEAAERAADSTLGDSWITLFDWIAVDLTDREWNHSLDDLKTVVFDAEAAGYRPVLAARGVLVYRRAGSELPLDDALRPWRVSASAAKRLAGRGADDVPKVPGLRVLRLAATPTAMPVGSPTTAKADVELVLQAEEDGPPEYAFRYRLEDSQGNTVSETAPRFPAGGNRPTSWWRKGEAWRDRLSIELPAGTTLAELHGRLQLVPLR